MRWTSPAAFAVYVEKNFQKWWCIPRTQQVRYCHDTQDVPGSSVGSTTQNMNTCMVFGCKWNEPRPNGCSGSQFTQLVCETLWKLRWVVILWVKDSCLPTFGLKATWPVNTTRACFQKVLQLKQESSHAKHFWRNFLFIDHGNWGDY